MAYFINYWKFNEIRKYNHEHANYFFTTRACLSQFAIYACATCALRKTNKQRIAAFKKRVLVQSTENPLGEALHEWRYW